jgi:hypothetical protein
MLFENFGPSATVAKKRWDTGTNGTNTKPFVFNNGLVPACPTVGQIGTKREGQLNKVVRSDKFCVPFLPGVFCG